MSSSAYKLAKQRWSIEYSIKNTDSCCCCSGRYEYSNTCTEKQAKPVYGAGNRYLALVVLCRPAGTRTYNTYCTTMYRSYYLVIRVDYKTPQH